MFIPAEMSEVDIFVYENDVHNVAQTVAQMAVLHLLDVNALGKWAEGVGTEWPGRVSAYASQERRVREMLAQLGIEELYYPCEGRVSPAEDLADIEKELQGIESETRVLRERESDLRRDREHWDLVSKSLETLAPLSVTMDELRQPEYLHMVVGTIPAENLARLEASLFRIPYSIIPVHRYSGRVLVFAFCAQEHAPILDRALESAFLDPLEIPEEFAGTPREALVQVYQRLAAADEALRDVEAARTQLAQVIAPQLLVLLTRIRRNQAIAEAMAHFGHRGRVFLIAGWVPKDRVAELRAAVEEATEGRVTFEENSPYAPGAARVPTLLRHSRLLKPIEQLVNTYGVPGYRELDPTLLVGITFTLMFGVMFGDLGHGLVLMALGAMLSANILGATASRASIGIILLACGLSSSVFGLLYGSFFGMEEIIPSLWLRPMNDILTLLGASVAFGVVLLNIGFAFRLATALRVNDLRSAVFDRNGIAGLGLYWGLAGVILMIVLGRDVPTVLYLWVLGFALMLFMAEPLSNLLYRRRPLIHDSVMETAVQAFFELFEAVISYVSNTLSYVRLGAFAVAHVGLTMVVFLIAEMVSTGPAGPVLSGAAILFGNMVVIIFEGLIVAIQTLRLEYYELFGKFFKGEGIPFKPLTLPEMECQPYQRIEERSRA
jgi:V/A-type H+-transporting ATPase subunit I